MEKIHVATVYILMKLNYDHSISLGVDKNGKKFISFHRHLVIAALEKLKVKEGERWDNAFVMEVKGTYQTTEEG
jgi:hypothetical protein